MRATCILAFAILSASSLSSQSHGEPTQRMRPGSLPSVESLLPAEEGSENEARLIAYLSSSIGELQSSSRRPVSLRILDYSEFPGAHSFSRVVRVSLEGKSNDTLLIAVPISTPRNATDESAGSIGIASLLHVVRYFSEVEPPVNLEIAFLGAERGVGTHYPLGSARLIRDLADMDIDAMVYFDPPVATGRFNVVTGAPGIVAPPWLTEAVRRSMLSAGLPTSVDAADHLYRIGERPSGRDYLIEPYLAADIPAVLVADSYSSRSAWNDIDISALRAAPPTTAEQRERISEHLASGVVDVVGAFESGIPKTWDRNAVSLVYGERRILVEEPAYLIFVLATIAFTLLYGVIFRTRLSRYIRTVRKNFWSIPILFLLSLLYLYLSGQLVAGIFALRGAPDLWKLSPAAGFAFKLIASILGLLVTYLTSKRLPLSRNGSFYSAAAILILLLNIVVFGSFSIATSAAFVLSFLFAFLFSASRRRYIKVFWLILSAAPPLYLARTVFALDAQDLIGRLVVGVPENAMLALVILPYLLLLIRVDFLIRHPLSGRRSFTLKVSATLLTIAAILLVTHLAVLRPFDASRPQEVRVDEVSDFTRETAVLKTQSVAEPVGLSLNYPGFAGAIANLPRRAEIDVDLPLRVGSIDAESEYFLGRRSIRIEVGSDVPIYEIDVRLLSANPLLVYEVNFPFTPIGDGTETAIHVGRNPPRELYLDVVVPAEADLTLETTITSPGIAGLSIDSEPYLHVQTFSVQKFRTPLSDAGEDN